MIEAGRVRVNGKTLDTPAFKVTGKEKIEVDGKLVGAPESTKLWRYHKPTGLVTTHSDPEGRETVFQKLPKDIGRVISIGRLDLTSEGLLLLTNDGALARALELPSTAWTRRYRARAYGKLEEDAVKKLQAGITVEGVRYGPMEVEIERETGSNVWLTIGLKEGKNREVRRALDAIGLKVNRLIRIAYGPFQLGDMEQGEVKSVPARILKDQCGHLLAEGSIKHDGTGQAKAAKPARKKPPSGPRGRKPGSRQAPGKPPSRSEQRTGPKTGQTPRGRSGNKPGPRR